MDTNEPTGIFYDRAEFLKAASSPEYAASARYRDDVAAKLQRSMEAGTISPMGEFINPADRTHTRNAYYADDNANGYIVQGADPTWAEAGKVGRGFFKSPEEIAAAFSAPAYEIDPTYQNAVREKIGRSIREGFLTPDLQAADPAERGR
ncbi:hypothetical protein [Phenylobacterium sp.]|uniref:hypothetical protein n=1 Tax=Phenylobacterium sp. TaxID=1871053 RepID=UPI0035B28243